jgi:transcriptional regulator GlxA family with amidase domain
MRDIDLHVLDGAMPSAVAISLDLIATANRLREAAGRAPAFHVRVSGSGRRVAQHMHVHRQAPSSRTARTTAAAPALLIIPGLGAVSEQSVMERLTRTDARAAITRVISTVNDGGLVAAGCSSAFLLAAAGVLDGRRATTTWWLAPAFQRQFPRVHLDVEAMVVHDGRLTTAGAAMAQLDLMLDVVRRHGSPSLAEQCARYLLLDGRRSQSRYMALGALAAADADVARAERWARAHIDTPFTMDELAAAAGLGTRTFARRVTRTTGLSPVRFVQRLRLEHATELLESTALSVEEIARRVGYAEPTTLRRLLRRHAGARPRELRGR